MGFQRIFLGTDRPGLIAAVDQVTRTFANGKWLDLSRVLLVTPGARASRRLREVLYQRARQDGLHYLPPKITTIGSVPESLYASRLPFASDWVQRLTWARAVREVETKIRKRVFPQTPNNPNEYSESDWLALGRLLQGTYRELAAELLTFADVADQGSQWTGFPEQDRWVSMAMIQNKYLELLRQRQLWDQQTARLRAIHDKECASESQLIFIGSSDIRQALRKMLDQVAEKVTALVFAPEEWRDRFDALGCVIPEMWQNATIDFSKTQISFVDSFSEQANLTVQHLADLGDGYGCDEVTIGCPDDRIVPHLQRAFSAHDLNARWVAGRMVTESPVYRCLMAIREAVTSHNDTGNSVSFQSYATLGRHPDIFAWLVREGVSNEWIEQSDKYRAEHLPARAKARWLGREEDRKHLVAAWSKLEQLISTLVGPAQPMSQWSALISKVLKTIYGTRQWKLEDAADSLAVGAFRAIRSFLTEQATLPPEIAPLVTGSEALELLLEQVDEQRVAPPSDPNSIELLGWLELPLDDAPVLVLTGLTEGVVPTSTTSDLFLPNSLRQHLNISDNERRYARDAYALSVLLCTRSSVHIVVGRTDEEGEPLRPSRLLFALPDDAVVERWKDYFDRKENVRPHPTPDANLDPGVPSIPNATFGFTVPRPPNDCDTVQSMSPTAFRMYLKCPYRFYLKYVLKLNRLEDESREMTGNLFGNVAHSVLEDFGISAAKDSGDAGDIRDALMDLLQAESRKRFGSGPLPAVRIQMRQLEFRLERFAKEQARVVRDGWRIRYVEQRSQELDPIPTIATINSTQSLALHGVVDRIDEHEKTGELRILDYKTSDAAKPPEGAHRKGKGANKEWVDLQLPLYRHIVLAMNLDRIGNDIRRLNQVGYILLPKTLSKVGFHMAKWTEMDFDAADKLAAEIVAKVLNREFWPPLDPTYDDYASILMSTVQERPDFADA